MTALTSRPTARDFRLLFCLASLSAAALLAPPAAAEHADPMPEGTVWDGNHELFLGPPPPPPASAPAIEQAADGEESIGELRKCTLKILHRDDAAGRAKFQITHKPRTDEWVVTCDVAGNRISAGSAQAKSAAYKLDLNFSGDVADERITLKYSGVRTAKRGGKSIDEQIHGTIVVDLDSVPPAAPNAKQPAADDASAADDETPDAGSADGKQPRRKGGRNRNRQNAQQQQQQTAKQTLRGTELLIENSPARTTGCEVRILEDNPQTGDFRFKLSRDGNSAKWTFACKKNANGDVSVAEIKPLRGTMIVNHAVSKGQFKSGVLRLHYAGYHMRARLKTPFEGTLEAQ